MPSLDLSDPIEARLTGCARRISQLLKSPAVAADAEAQSSLDDFLGAVYALIRARFKKFQDRPGRPIDIKFVVQRAAKIAGGSIKTDGLWIAGFYFNNALFRTAAVYDRMLQVATGHDGYVPALQLAALTLYPNWNSIKLFKVHSQVNELKHEPQGVYNGRLVTYEDALPRPATCSTSSRPGWPPTRPYLNHDPTRHASHNARLQRRPSEAPGTPGT